MADRVRPRARGRATPRAAATARRGRPSRRTSPSGGRSSGGARPARSRARTAPKIDYKDIKLLQRFVSERGKIVPRRITAVTAKEQRSLAQAIQRARAAGAAAVHGRADGRRGRRVSRAASTGPCAPCLRSSDSPSSPGLLSSALFLCALDRRCRAWCCSPISCSCRCCSPGLGDGAHRVDGRGRRARS